MNILTAAKTAIKWNPKSPLFWIEMVRLLRVGIDKGKGYWMRYRAVRQGNNAASKAKESELQRLNPDVIKKCE